MFAQPIGTWPPHEAIERVRDIQQRDGIDTIVVGWPLLADGTEGESAKRVELFVKRLLAAVGVVPVVKWDERYTSEIAKETIRMSGARRKARRNKERVDAAAAAIILQEFLDQHS